VRRVESVSFSFAKISILKSNLINGQPSKLDREQGPKPLFNESLNVAAEQAAEKPNFWCHSKRSQESLFALSPIHREILRFAQNDKRNFFRSLGSHEP
jgi:hypothetical protein